MVSLADAQASKRQKLSDAALLHKVKTKRQKKMPKRKGLQAAYHLLQRWTRGSTAEGPALRVGARWCFSS